MDQDIFIKEDQFDLSDPLNIQENEMVSARMKVAYKKQIYWIHKIY